MRGQAARSTRRGFLRRGLSAVAAAMWPATCDPERLLWVPGARTFFLPSPRLIGGDVLTVEWLTRESMSALERQLGAQPTFGAPWHGGALIHHDDSTVGVAVQYRYLVHPDWRPETMRRHVIEPMVAALARQIRQRGLTASAPLLLTDVGGGEVVRIDAMRSGLSLRGVRHAHTDEMATPYDRFRLDFLGR